MSDPRDNLPTRVVVGANGAYWRDYGDREPPGYSMCPVSTDNEVIVPIATYVRQTSDETSDEGLLRRAALSVLLELDIIRRNKDATGVNFLVVNHGSHDALRAALHPTTHAPGESHTYRTECDTCGQPGQLRISLEPQTAPE